MSGIEVFDSTLGLSAPLAAAVRNPKPGHLGLAGFGQSAVRASRAICAWPKTQVDRVDDAGDEGRFPEETT